MLKVSAVGKDYNETDCANLNKDLSMVFKIYTGALQILPDVF